MTERQLEEKEHKTVSKEEVVQEVVVDLTLINNKLNYIISLLNTKQ